jgi:sRNA-binding protein
MFGGKSAREGVTSTIAVKGDRKMTTNDSTAQIVDLAEEKVYDLDLKKKSYTVTTFAELRRRMEEARKKADENARKEAAREKEKEKPAAADPNAKQVEIDFDIKNTGAKKTVNGFDTHQAVMTITVREKGKTLEEGGGMVVTSDMWLAQKIAAMKEVTDFDMRYAQKLYGTMIAGVSAEQMAAAMAMYPMMKQALGKMSAEGGKIEGTPIQTTTTMDAVKSADQIAEEAKAGSNDNKSAAAGGVSGMLGGFAKKMAQKKMGGDDANKDRATFMTTTSEVLKVVTDVSAADVAVPTGFKENK